MVTTQACLTPNPSWPQPSLRALKMLNEKMKKQKSDAEPKRKLRRSANERSKKLNVRLKRKRRLML